MDENELYEKVCNPRLKKIEEGVQQVLKLLIGDNDHPETPGLCERIRKIESCYKKFRRVISWAAGILFTVWVYGKAGAIFSFLSKIFNMSKG